MLYKVRENIFLGDERVSAKELKENAITVILVVSDTVELNTGDQLPVLFHVSLFPDKINKPHVKDIACHIPKYMTENGETIAVIDKTATQQAAYIVARAICELEQKSIYEVFVELKEILPKFDIGKAYL